MIDEMKLIGEIEESMRDNTHTDEKVKANHHMEHMHFLSLALRQPKIKLNQWHVVADGDLPKEETTVLVKLSNGEVITGGLSDTKRWYIGNQNVFWDFFWDIDFYEDNVSIVEWKEI